MVVGALSARFLVTGSIPAPKVTTKPGNRLAHEDKPLTQNALSETLSAEQSRLITLIVAEHDQALRQFVKGKIWSNASNDFEDVVQEVYLRITQYTDLASIDNLRAFLFSMASNLLKDRARRNAVRQSSMHISLVDNVDEPETPALENGVAAAQQLEQLKGVIMSLSERPRQVFLLSRFEGLSYPQIAERLGISVKAVEKNMSKALKICRKKVGYSI